MTSKRPTFRPWGLLDWVLPRLPVSEWAFLGGLSSEDRSAAAWETTLSAANVTKSQFVRVVDPPSRYSSTITSKCDAIALRLISLGLDPANLISHPLFVRTEELIRFITAFAGTSCGNIVFDLSSLPKRFFFPITRLLLDSAGVNNLIITYTVPATYASDSLSEDPEPWRHIPLFAPPYPEPDLELLIVGVGFESLALAESLEDDYHAVSVKFLFPFPPGPPSFQRTWEFVRNIEKNFSHVAREPIRVDALDVSDTFDHILALTDHANQYAVLAPYGPKTISLAMCLYAVSTGAPVYYTQPTVYHPDYSTGVSQVGGHDEIYAYCVKLQGRNLYGL